MIRIIVLTVLALLASPGYAGWLDLVDLDYDVALPPSKSSPEAHADLAEVLRAQVSRTDAQCVQAGLGPEAMFQSAFGESGVLSAREMRRMRTRVRAMAYYAAVVSSGYKLRYGRARPFEVDVRVQPCIADPEGSSYPSGHATAAAAVACLLAQKYPDRAPQLLAIGEQLAQLRVIAGVHFPSDVRAGVDLGYQICGKYIERVVNPTQ